MKSPQFLFRRPKAFSLVEVTLALGVAGFCLLAIFGLLPVGLNSNKISVEQSDAANIAIGVIADLRATPLALTTSPRFQFKVPAAGVSGSITPQILFFTQSGAPLGQADASPGTAAGTAAPVYRVAVGYGASSKTKTASPVRIMVTWPALAGSRTGWPTIFAGSFETQVAINRN